MWALGYHEGPLQSLVHRLKYDSETFIADWLGPNMAQLPAPWSEVDALVPIPLHPLRLVERGYNQSALLARSVGRYHKLPFLTGVVERRSATLAQASLGKKARRENIRGAFLARRASEAHKVMLVDDVVTTGSTSDALRNALEAVGHQVVGVIAVSVARPKSP